MENYLKQRPRKVPLPQEQQDYLRKEAVEKILRELLPDERILKILLIGSSVKGSFGTYDSPGFRGSLYSDFDFIVFVEDEYQIPSWLQREPDGKPFPQERYNLAFRQKKWLDRFDAEIFFVRRSTWENPELEVLGETAGIPMSERSAHPNAVLFTRGAT